MREPHLPRDRGERDEVALEVEPADDAVLAFWSAVEATPAAEATGISDAEGKTKTMLHRPEVARPRRVAGQPSVCVRRRDRRLRFEARGHAFAQRGFIPIAC